MADEARHKGEYWLTVDWTGVVDWSSAEWSNRPIRGHEGDWIHQRSFYVPDFLHGALRSLADPDRPVKVRIEMRAVPVEEETDDG